MHFSIPDHDYGNGSSQTRRKRGVLQPVIDKVRGAVHRDSIEIEKNCGPDDICVPDLQLNVSSVESYILGSPNLLVLDVLISNLGEDAFEAGFFMTIPKGLLYRKIERIGKVRDTPITCNPPSPATNNTVKCDIGNPMPQHGSVNFRVTLLPRQQNEPEPEFIFFMEANSTNPENSWTLLDNTAVKAVDLLVEADLELRCNLRPERIYYKVPSAFAFSTATTKVEISPEVKQYCEIVNHGPAEILKAEIYFVWPFQTVDQDALLDLLDQPETTENIVCERSEVMNESHSPLKKSQRSFEDYSEAVDEPRIERLELNLPCENTRCSMIRCVVSNLEQHSSALFAVKMRLVAATANSVAPGTQLNMSTMVAARTIQLPFIGEPLKLQWKRVDLKLVAESLPEPKPDIALLSLIAGSACVGLIILSWITYLLNEVSFLMHS